MTANQIDDKDTPLHLELQAEWAQWLVAHHDTSRGVWLRHAKKGAPRPTLTYAQALEVALCFGWIDGQKKRENVHYWLQRFTPRTANSIWSKINRDSALKYIADGRMQPSGLAEIERARADGRWNAAYDSASTAVVPADLQAAFATNLEARNFFATLNAQNRFAILFRIRTAKKAETRARRIAQFVDMLARHETLHPMPPSKT
jgi:uncharacterized protein YdeI (YjbR/CyaY-like superfamily)